MQIKWRKFEGGYAVMIYLEDTKCFIIPQERWVETVIYTRLGVRGYGSTLRPIADV